MVNAGESQRWSQLRMMMTRQSDGTMLVSLVLRRQDGRQTFDRRLDMAVVPLQPGGPASSDALEACLLAVRSLQVKRDSR